MFRTNGFGYYLGTKPGGEFRKANNINWRKSVSKKGVTESLSLAYQTKPHLETALHMADPR